MKESQSSPASARYGHDRRLSTRVVVTIAVLTAFYILVVGALIYAGVVWYLVIGAALVAVLTQWMLASRMVLASIGAEVVDADEAPRVFEVVQRLSALHDIPMPTLAIDPSPVPNAFAAGTRPDDAVVCVSTGLLEILDDEELEAVLAHELAHIAHRDVAVMTMSATGSTVAGTLMRVSAAIAAVSAAAGATMGASRRREDGGGAGFAVAVMMASLAIMVLSSVVYAISVLLVRALSRYRELAADRSAVLMTGRPSAMAAALTKVVGAVGQIPTDDLRAAGGVSSLAFVPGLRDDHPLRWLLATHPTLDQRLENIAKVAAQLGKP